MRRPVAVCLARALAASAPAAPLAAYARAAAVGGAARAAAAAGAAPGVTTAEEPPSATDARAPVPPAAPLPLASSPRAPRPLHRELPMAWSIPDGAAAAALRALDVQGVVRWAALLLPDDPGVPVALQRQRMDGAALLAASAELLRGHYGLPDGPARALVSAVEAARGLLPRDAVFKLRLLLSRGAWAYTVSVTPDTFAARFTSL